MKAFAFAMTGVALTAGCALAQEAISLTRLPSGATPSLSLADRDLLAPTESERRKPGLSVKRTLIAVDTRYDGGHKKLGVALPSLSSSPLELSYDPSGKSLMAQWRSVYSTAAGQVLQYRAFVGESGAVNFMLSSQF